MDIEKLTKSQIILLTLFVSFVTSIATGIVTVALFEQVPENVTHTIDRVIERTVERAVSAENLGEQSANALVTEKITTVVVQEDDVISDTIAKESARVVRIFSIFEEQSEDASTTVERAFEGLGALIGKGGIILTADNVLLPGKTYEIIDAEGNSFPAEILIEGVADIGFLRSVANEASTTIFSVPALTLIDQHSLRLGQTVIQLSGSAQGVRVSLGVIAQLEYIKQDVKKDEIEKNNTQLKTLSTSIYEKPERGALLLGMFGETIAIFSGKEFIPLSQDAMTSLLSFASSLDTENSEVE